MSELLSAVKLLILSSLLIIGLQMKWDGQTLEKLALSSLHQSQIGQMIEDVAMGATKAAQRGYEWAKAKISNISAPAEQKAGR